MKSSLRELADIQYGSSPKEIRVIDATLFKIFGTGGFVGYSKEKLFEGPLIVVARKGTLDKPIFSEYDCWVIDTAFAVIPKNDVDAKWLFYQLSNFDLKKLNEATGVPSISRDYLYKVVFDKPSLLEQRQIRNILDTVGTVIEKTERSLEKLNAIKQGMMQDLFTRGLDENGKLRPRYEEAPELYHKTKIGWVPKEWDVLQIENSQVEIIDGDRGLNYPSQNELSEFGFCIFLNANNVTKSGFKFNNVQYINKFRDEKLGSGKLARYDIVLTTRGTVGNISYYNSIISFDHIRINSGMIILRNKDKDLSSEYLFQSLRDFIYQIEIKKMISGSAQPQLPIKDIKKFNLLKPPFEEQKKTIKLINSIDKKIDSEEIYLSKLYQLKQGLMQDLLSGKKRVNIRTSELSENLKSY